MIRLSVASGVIREFSNTSQSEMVTTMACAEKFDDLKGGRFAIESSIFPRPVWGNFVFRITDNYIFLMPIDAKNLPAVLRLSGRL